jgi:hypothetical protein
MRIQSEPRSHRVTKKFPGPGAASCLHAFVVLTLFLSGCGYNGYSTPGDEPKNSWYQWRSLYREDVKTVAVPIFKNKDYRRGVEFALSKAVIQQIEMRTPYKVVDEKKADTILEGEIVEIKVHTLSQNTRNALPQEQIYDIKVNFRWKDNRNGVILCDRTNFEQTTTFYETLGESEFAGSQYGVERLALGIVQELQADW